MLSLLLLTLSAALAQAVAVSPEVGAHAQAPRWSPDGSRLSWELNDHSQRAVSLHLSAPGVGVTQVNPAAKPSAGLTTGFGTAPKSAVVHELSWSPKALNTYVYSAAGDDREYDLFLQGGTRLAASPGVDGGPAWSPDGQYIVFSSARTGQGDLYLLRAEALDRAPTRLTAEPTTSELHPAWSPQSNTLAYVGRGAEGDTVFVITNLSAPNPIALAPWGHTQTRPRFSPDGSKLAFYSNHEDKSRFDLYIVELSTGRSQKVVAGVVINEEGPVWLPSSDGFVFVLDDDARFDPLMRVGLDGKLPKPVATRTVGNTDHDLVSVNGKIWLAVAAQGELKGNDRDFRRIYVMELPTSP